MSSIETARKYARKAIVARARMFRAEHFLAVLMSRSVTGGTIRTGTGRRP